MQYQNIWIKDLEDSITTFVMTLDLETIEETNLLTLSLLKYKKCLQQNDALYY